MLLQKIARNHPEDTVSDIIWYICKKDPSFAENLISPFISYLNEFTIIDIVRNYIISDGYIPDLTFLLSHKETNKIIYIIIETKITASQNIHERKSRTKKQYSIYKKYLNEKNKKANLGKKYTITDKCILLCPSYYNLEGEEDNVIELRFPSLLNLLKNSTTPIKKELIKYIEEEFEGTYTELNENLEILNHKIEFKNAQKHILALRHTMLNEEEISKSGLWQSTSECYCYFSVGLRTSYTPRKEKKSWKHRSWLSYEFYIEDDIYSPLKLSFLKKLVKKDIIHVAKYQNKNKFYCDLLTESKINPNFIEIFDWLQCSEELKEIIIQFTEYYKQSNKQSYLVKFNKFLSSILSYLDRFTNKISSSYPHTVFEHSLNNSEILLCLTIKTRSNGKHHISIIAEPTSFDVSKLLRMEVFEDSEQVSTSELISARKNGFQVKYDLNALKEKIDSTFREFYES